MLSNKGASIGILIIIVALFFLGYFIYFISLFSHYDKNDNYEEKMNKASLKYVNKYYADYQGEGSLIIKLSNLEKYEEIDLDGCSGYSIVNKDSKFSVNSYLKCDKYITKGYNEIYE